jgi:orotate phosphoribosyltransferase
MPDARGQELLGLVGSRQGHFALESGHHGGQWLDLDTLFSHPARVRPHVDRLAEALLAHRPQAVCGPLVGGAFLAQMLSAALTVEFLFTERFLPVGREGLYPAEYRLPRALQHRARGRRVAVVDDAISAGSAVRGTYAELRAHGAEPVVIGALLSLGSAAERFFSEQSVPVASVAQLEYELWLPESCRLCAAGLPLEIPNPL